MARKRYPKISKRSPVTVTAHCKICVIERVHSNPQSNDRLHCMWPSGFVVGSPNNPGLGDFVWDMRANNIQGWWWSRVPVFSPGLIAVKFSSQGSASATRYSSGECSLQTEKLHWKHLQVINMLDVIYSTVASGRARRKVASPPPPRCLQVSECFDQSL